MAVRGEGRPLHACVNSTNYFYIIVFYTVNSLLQQHTQKHVTYGKWVEIIIREFWNFIREKSGKNQGILFSWNAGNPGICFAGICPRKLGISSSSSSESCFRFGISRNVYIYIVDIFLVLSSASLENLQNLLYCWPASWNFLIFVDS